ncbi:MAG: site-specific integrase [Clostridiales bacterium]|nr:site-specific integrase [Clostridiales bacterium]
MYTGLRIGELCGLKWEDIDFENSLMKIQRTQARIGGEIIFTLPKSPSSSRVIPIQPFLLEKLKKCRRDSEFVISKKGSYVDVRGYRRRFKTLLKEAELPDIRFHALRHTFSSRALEVGMDFKTISEILGHSSVSITLDLYVHSLYEHKKEEMNKLDRFYNCPSLN